MPEPLSAKEYALAEVSRMRPIAQIMGSSDVPLTEVPPALPNAELPDVAVGLAETRLTALAKVRGQAAAVGTDRLVVSTLRHKIEHHEYGARGRQHHYFHITFHVVGTAIKSHAREPYPAAMPAPTLAVSLNT